MANSVNHQTQATTTGQHAYVRMTKSADKRIKRVMIRDTSVIPVIFLPGIMGSNLIGINKKKIKKIVWEPGSLINAWSLIRKRTKTRQQDLNPDTTSVYHEGTINSGFTGLPKKILNERGWGEILHSAYHGALSNFMTRLNQIIQPRYVNKPGVEIEWYTPKWQSMLETDPAIYGGASGKAAERLTEAELDKAAQYRFDIWACGYNWLQSNEVSGKIVFGRIKEILALYNQRKEVKPVAEKVIVVTHSMGGLVARSMALEEGFSDVVLGVVHSVQPATGSSAAYHHIRSGFGSGWSPTNRALGHSGERVTSVLAKSSGGLELLPTMDFNDSQPWLKYKTSEQANEDAQPICKGGDASYTDIYKSTEWYGLVPTENENLLDLVSSISPKEKSKGKTARTQFERKIDKVQDFHNKIKAQYFNPTIAIAESDTESGQKTWNEVYWRLSGKHTIDSLKVYPNIKLVGSGGDASVSFSNELSSVNAVFEAADENQPGDGTVSAVSGEAPYKHVAGYFQHGRYPRTKVLRLWANNARGITQAKEVNGIPSFCHKGNLYAHDDAYNSELTITSALHGIIKIAQNADWADPNKQPLAEVWTEEALKATEEVKESLNNVEHIGDINLTDGTKVDAKSYTTDLVVQHADQLQAQGIMSSEAVDSTLINPTSNAEISQELLVKNHFDFAGEHANLIGQTLGESLASVNKIVDGAHSEVALNMKIDIFKKQLLG